MFKYHFEMGHCFSQLVVVSKKSKKKYWGDQTWYWEKRWLFLIGNGAQIRPLEKDRKSDAIVLNGMKMAKNAFFYNLNSFLILFL